MRNRIFVLSHNNQWGVKCEHCGEEFFATQHEAIKVAKQHVASYPAGALAQILVQGNDSRWITEWTYGNDPFPPRG